MSQIFVCVIKREKHTIPPAFLEQIAQLASRSDMYVFCPPKYIEEFMRTPKYGNLLVFDLADNDEYDDCEEFYYTVDCDLQNKRIETMVHIARRKLRAKPGTAEGNPETRWWRAKTGNPDGSRPSDSAGNRTEAAKHMGTAIFRQQLRIPTETERSAGDSESKGICGSRIQICSIGGLV